MNAMSKPAPASVPEDGKRRALRKAVKLKARMRDMGTSPFEIDVVDLSVTGFRAETSFTLYPGNLVFMRLPGLASLEAIVEWRERYKYGCSFVNPLHPAVFDHIVRLSER